MLEEEGALDDLNDLGDWVRVVLEKEEVYDAKTIFKRSSNEDGSGVTEPDPTVTTATTTTTTITTPSLNGLLMIYAIAAACVFVVFVSMLCIMKLSVWLWRRKRRSYTLQSSFKGELREPD